MIPALVAAFAALGGFVAGCTFAGPRCAHTWTLQLSRDRVWLECPTCGERSPGWGLTLEPLDPLDREDVWPTIQ